MQLFDPRSGKPLLVPTCPEHSRDRRRMLKMALAMGLLPAGGWLAPAVAQTRLRPTPDQDLGPFYPVKKPLDGGADLTRLPGRPGRAQGQILYVMGRVLNREGEPVAGARLEIWQANGAGRYSHPTDWNTTALDPNFEGYANVVTDGEGRYRFKTIKPGAYPVGGDWVRPPHIHYDVLGHVNRLVTQMYFEGDPLNDKDRLLQSSWGKDRLLARVMPPTAEEEPDAQLAVWDIVLFTG